MNTPTTQPSEGAVRAAQCVLGFPASHPEVIATARIIDRETGARELAETLHEIRALAESWRELGRDGLRTHLANIEHKAKTALSRYAPTQEKEGKQ